MAQQQAMPAAYEQPLNERIRTLLRLEFLFQEIDWTLNGDSPWHSRQSVATLLDILSVLSSRGDIRGELIKELERIAGSLERLRHNPDVDSARLQPLLEDCRRLAAALKSVRGLPGSELKNNDLLNGVMQRAGIPGGTCSFDLPAYQHWLLQPAAERRAQLQAWFGPLETLQQATALVLRLLRESAEPESLVARDGLFQQSPDRSASYQLIRVLLPADAPYFAEISGSKYFFTVRFLQQRETGERPVQTRDDVAFQLCRCGL